MGACNIKFAKPDTKKPSSEQWKEAHELALEVWEMEPWVDFIEEQVLAIEFADGTRRFLSVMGVRGEHRAIALYPDAATYWRMRGPDPDNETDIMDAFMSTSQLQLCFGKASTLVRFGMRPSHIASTNAQVKAIMKGLCATDFRGTEVLPLSWCDSAREIFEDISDRMFR